MVTILELFENKNVFVTGATGFLGQTLIEKLLRSCPTIGNIFVLVRPKRGRSLSERIDDIVASPLFNDIKRQNPEIFNKIKPIEGDLKKIKLGIKKEDEELLVSTLNFIYHIAATVRFDEPLKEALLINVRSTRDIAKLALKCKKLELFFHISTCYCNVDHPVIEEKFYSPPMDWKVCIRLAENEDNCTDVLSMKCIQGWPNTYTFSKRLGEAAVVSLLSGKLPVVILRPSIVIYNIGDPQPGWNAKMSGPFSLSTAVLKGVISLIYGDPDTALNMVFVDNVVKAMIIATKEKVVSNNPLEIAFYNTSSDLSWTLKNFKDCYAIAAEKLPYSGRIWSNENAQITKCWYYYYLMLITTHLTYAALVDIILRLAGQQPLVFKITRRIHITMQALEYFMHNKFSINNSNYLELEKTLSEQDTEHFKYIKKGNSAKDIEELVLIATSGVKKFILKEPVPPKEETFKNTFRMYAVKVVATYLMLFWLMYLFFWRYDLGTATYHKVSNYWEHLDTYPLRPHQEFN